MFLIFEGVFGQISLAYRFLAAPGHQQAVFSGGDNQLVVSQGQFVHFQFEDL